MFHRPFLGNQLIFLGVAVELLVTAFLIYTPWGNVLVGTSPLPLADWLFVVPFAIGMAALEEVRKAVVRRRNRQ